MSQSKIADVKSKICAAVYATMARDAADGCAVLYWARGLPDYPPPLRLLDWEERQFMPSAFEDVDARLVSLAKERWATNGSIGLFVEDPRLAALAKQRGRNVRPIHEHLTQPAAWDQLWTVAAFYIREGSVGVTDVAREKFKSSAFAALTFSGGERPNDDPTVPAWLYGIVIGLDAASARIPPSAKLTAAKGQSQR